MYLRWAVLAHVVVFIFQIGAVGHSTTNLVGIVPNNLRNMIRKHDQELIPRFLLVTAQFDSVKDDHGVAAVYLRVVASWSSVGGSPQVVAVVLHLAMPAHDSIAPGGF